MFSSYFWSNCALFDYIFWGSDPTHFAEYRHKWFFYRWRNLKNEHFEAIILKQSNGVWQSGFFFLMLLEKSVLFSPTSSLAVNTGVWVKVVTNGSFSDKQNSKKKISIFETIIVKQKRRRATKKFVFLCWFWNVHALTTSYFLELNAHVSAKVATNGFDDGFGTLLTLKLRIFWKLVQVFPWKWSPVVIFKNLAFLRLLF